MNYWEIKMPSIQDVKASSIRGIVTGKKKSMFTLIL